MCGAGEPDLLRPAPAPLLRRVVGDAVDWNTVVLGQDATIQTGAVNLGLRRADASCRSSPSACGCWASR